MCPCMCSPYESSSREGMYFIVILSLVPAFVLSSHRHDVPLKFASFMRNSGIMRATCGCDCGWENVENGNIKHQIMNKYFGKGIRQDQSCELFLIGGVPAASMIYNQTNRFDQPVVDAFYLNKGLLLMFDAGSHMRHKLYKRYHLISLQRAVNKHDFLQF